jgi:hypothetical protein
MLLKLSQIGNEKFDKNVDDVDNDRENGCKGIAD